MPRIKPRDLLPRTVNTRNFGGIIISAPSDIVGDANSFSFTFGNSDQALITSTLETEDNSKLFAVPDISFYVGSVSAANQLPGGGNIDETNYQVIGPWHDWGTTDNKNVKVKNYILNISAGSVTIIGRIVWRYIANNPNATVVTT